MPVRRLHRRLVAWLLAFCVLFAQTVAAAYACQRQAEALADAERPCSAHLADGGAVPLPFDNGNVCEVHCHPVSLPDAGGTDVPAPAVAVLWVLPLLPQVRVASAPPADLETRNASPPARTLFVRLLI